MYVIMITFLQDMIVLTLNNLSELERVESGIQTAAKFIFQKSFLCTHACIGYPIDFLLKY